ncbi:MAG TPA: LemA family protein [Gemmatimonadales bacterium]|jgi:LemA protein
MRRSRYSAPLLAGLVILASGCSYNRLQRLDEQINQASSQIKVQLQQRNDLIPNLVSTVKGITNQEDTVFISIANARAKMSGALQTNDMQQIAAANTAMAAPLGRLLAIQENYPTLQSSQNFRTLQDQLEGMEHRIATARTDYNTAVQQFNSAIRQFPTVITAKMFGLGKPRPYFDLTSPGAANVPTVKFN